MKKILDVCYNEEKNLCLDIHLPEAAEFPVFVYFHGGGLENGCKSDHRDVFEYLADHGIASVSVDYRMYPTARYPDFVEDAAEACAWVKKNMCAYGRVTGIFPGGSSAGGYLSQMLCFDGRWLATHGLVPTDFTAFIHDAGQPTSHFNVLRERGIDPRRVIVDESAPLYHICEESVYPPMLVLVSDNDRENRPEQTALLVSTLKHFGQADTVEYKIVENSTHCRYIRTQDAEGNNLFATMVRAYIEKILG